MIDIIQDRFSDLEKQHNVEILYACEAGSRAWGFESPDSDYDIRFIYRHPEEWYLSLSERRDVIERMDRGPNREHLDLVGWDIRKTLRLLKKSNASLLEWLQSPIVYRTPDWSNIGPSPHNLGNLYYSPRRAAYSYYHMARGNFREYLKGDRVRLKKYLYVLRPLLAARHIRRGDGFPPVNFEQLLEIEKTNGLDPLVEFQIRALLYWKKKTPESGEGSQRPILNSWIESELKKNPDNLEYLPDFKHDAEELDILFRRMIK